VAHEFGMARWQPERKGCTGASNWWLSPWRAHQRSPNVCNTSCYDVVRHQGTWHTIVERLTPARMIPTSCGPSGYSGTTVSEPELIRAQDFYSSPLSTCAGHESPRLVRIRAHGSPAARWTEPGDLIRTLYHWKPNSERLTDRVATPRSWIFV
jgi:hypothetical protein